MGQVNGQFIVKTFVKAMICENCKALRVSVQGKPHICAAQRGRRVGGGQVIVLSKHKTTVLVTSAE
jgi:hypothetical protein